MAVHTQPSQFDTAKGIDWYKENVRFVYSHYNAKRTLLDARPQNQGNSQNAYETPVDEMIRMVSYYMGKQSNRDYYYTTQTADGCDPLPTVWISGQKVTGLIDFMLGTGVKMVDNIEPSVRLNSKAAVNRKTTMLEKLLLKKQAAELFADMSSYGIEFSPMGGQEDEFESEQDIERFMMYDYKEKGDIIAQRMCEDILLRNEARQKYKLALHYALITGKAGIKNRMENGREYFSVVEPWALIWDNGKDNDFNSEARFVGEVKWMTPSDIMEQHGHQLSMEEITELKKMTGAGSMDRLGLTNVPYSAHWYKTYQGMPLMAAAEVYWVGMKDLRMEKVNDKYGNTHYAKIRKKNKAGEYWVKTVYKGTLIGDKYLVNYGEDTNIVRKHDNPGEVELPIKVFVPNMIGGDNRSVVSRLHIHQDRIDYFTNEITKMVNKAKGKNFVFNEEKAGGKTPSSILKDFELWGISTINSASGEDDDSKYKRLVDVVDMTLDPNVQQLIALRREEERLMEEIVNIPKIALGQQSGYVGAKTQAGTIAQSNLGTASLYQGFVGFIEHQLRHALNQYKLGAISEDENDIPVVGTDGIRYLKIMKDFQFEEIGTYIKIRDFIDEQARERLLGMAQAFAQNQAITFEDYLNIEQCRTFTELRAELMYAVRKRVRDAEKQQQMQMQMMQMQQEAQLQANVAPEQLRQEGANYRKEVEVASQMPPQGQEQQEPDLEM